MNKRKKWALGVLFLTAAVLALVIGLTVVIDPLFHFHKPLTGLSYNISDERYQNDGIVKHFDYNAIITGTSMTENFQTSELDTLFCVKSIKVPFSGATYKEISDNLRRAFAANDHVKMVVRGLDINGLMEHSDQMRQDAEFPEYLYDSNPFNDVSYVLNKQILLQHTMKTLQRTYGGLETTSFDEYASWWPNATFGVEQALKGVCIPSQSVPQTAMTSEEIRITRENVTVNLTELARENPDVTFYYFFTPYSAAYWCGLYSSGNLEREIQAILIAAEELLKCENIHLFSFAEEYGWTENLNYYMDQVHYSQQVNSWMLRDMSKGDHLLTPENYEDHWSQVLEHYLNMDYMAWAQEQGFCYEVKEKSAQ